MPRQDALADSNLWLLPRLVTEYPHHKVTLGNLTYYSFVDDFGTGDYTDTGEEGVDIDTPNFVPDALTTTRRPTTTTPRMVVVFQRPRPRTTLRPSTRGRTTPPEDKPWLENRVVEDTVLNRLLDFVENFAQGKKPRT